MRQTLFRSTNLLKKIHYMIKSMLYIDMLLYNRMIYMEEYREDNYCWVR